MDSVSHCRCRLSSDLSDLVATWRSKADDYLRLHRTARCNCSSADRETYLRVALQLKQCADQVEALHMKAAA